MAAGSVWVPRVRLQEFYSRHLAALQGAYGVRLEEREGAEETALVQFGVRLEAAHAQLPAADLLAVIQSYVESSLGVSQTVAESDECGEDSSYDSDCEPEEGASSHRTASRTPSDTLAAEFAEYVTISQPPQHEQAKIIFAVKLGYSERTARTALQRLGPDPPQNELLEELIKIDSRRSPRPDTPPETISEPEPLPERSPLRHIVIDGSNVAMSHSNKKVFSARGIGICVDWFRSRGHTEITVFVPKWRKECRPDNPVTDRDALDRLERERVLVYTPSRLVGGKRIVSYDDRYILKLAAETNGVVVSNDNYRDLVQESPEFRQVVENRLLMYSFVNDRFMPPDDPLGRSGPTLDAFLRLPLARVDLPPACPYARKCTYGNKCKFHHPERAGRPYKFVAEKLSERAARVLGTRDLYTLSLPPTDQQPETSKRPLIRAKSATPRFADSTLVSHFDRAQLSGPSNKMLQRASHAANPHRKLARQLTLNPSCDPRLATLGAQAAATLGAHAAAARVASAPVGVTPEGAWCSWGASSACASESALPMWETRRRMQYHLAGIFPEAQVAEAMAAYPEETDAQKMCAIILARYRPA